MRAVAVLHDVLGEAEPAEERNRYDSALRRDVEVCVYDRELGSGFLILLSRTAAPVRITRNARISRRRGRYARRVGQAPLAYQ